MNFEVNGIPYFLTFDDQQAQWFLLTPSDEGLASVEIHGDEPLTSSESHSPFGGSMRGAN